jgi:hypothetical protein
VLPVLYALLGSAAYLLREFEQQLRTRTLTKTDAQIAHFVVAGISGAVVGRRRSTDRGAAELESRPIEYSDLRAGSAALAVYVCHTSPWAHDAAHNPSPKSETKLFAAGGGRYDVCTMTQAAGPEAASLLITLPLKHAP